MSKASHQQAKILRGQSLPLDNGTTARNPIDPSLTIRIPKPPSLVKITPGGPTAPPKLKTANEASPKEDDETPEDVRPYRQRLLEKLGHHYKGVEKYRLQQDEKRERHWKRWGPYLSERQWVRLLWASSAYDQLILR
jgi:hypothetical protein